LIASTVIIVTGWLKSCILGMLMGYDEAFVPRARFVHPRDGLILWAYSVIVASTKLASV
jgi:hypothetical protein